MLFAISEIIAKPIITFINLSVEGRLLPKPQNDLLQLLYNYSIFMDNNNVIDYWEHDLHISSRFLQNLTHVNIELTGPYEEYRKIHSGYYYYTLFGNLYYSQKLLTMFCNLPKVGYLI